ncbi:MAG: NUDIX hydrolase [Sedimentisphaerales bacterium]|nr:NUDIX hydrolase [Sedimentisphaerales bacterium]
MYKEKRNNLTMNCELPPSEVVYAGRTLDVIHSRTHPGGKRIVEYEFVRRRRVAMAIPLPDRHTVLMVHQYRPALNARIWEFPAGTIEDGESPLEAARRELEEETGYKSGELQLVLEFFTSPHFSDEKVHVFVARDLGPGSQRLREKEFLSVHQVARDSLLAKCRGNEIIDAKTIVACDYLLRDYVE